MQVKISQATSAITKIIRAGLVVMLAGSPAIGKSQVVKQIAMDYGLKVIDLRLSQCDPTNLSGFPTIKGNKAGFIPMDTFPIEGDEIPEGYNGWLLFLDEFNSAPEAVQAAAYKLVLDKQVGMHKLHKNVAIVCAGNLETDNAIVTPLSTAMQSRLIHLELVADAKEWVNWATGYGIDHRITSYINFKPSAVYTFHPDHSDKTYASPRTWEYADKILKITDEGCTDRLPILIGTLSEGVAREFTTFCKIYKNLPTIESILSNPTGTPMPEEPSTIYALCGAIASQTTAENIGNCLTYVSRMPVEFQVVCLREAIQRNKKLLTVPAMQAWISSSAAELF